MNSKKSQKDMTLEDEPPRSEGVQYATGEEQRAIQTLEDSRGQRSLVCSKQSSWWLLNRIPWWELKERASERVGQLHLSYTITPCIASVGQD